MKRIILIAWCASVALPLSALDMLAYNKCQSRKVGGGFGFEFASLGGFEKALFSNLSKQPLNARNVVEFGGGFGRIALKVVEKINNVDYLCTDISSAQIEELNDTMTKASFAEDSRLRTLQCDCTGNIAIADESADVVVIANVFHFLHPSDFLKVMTTAQRILKPHGRLFVMNQTPHFTLHDAKKIADSFTVSINNKSKQGRRILAAMERSVDLTQLWEMKAQINTLSAEKKREREERAPYLNNVFNRSCFTDLARRYQQGNLSFPGYIAHHSLAGEEYFEDGTSTPFNAMNRPHMFMMSGKEFAAYAEPFGFVLIETNDYEISEDSTKQVEEGTYFGAIVEKSGKPNENAIAKLKSLAEGVNAERDAFHRGHKIIYSERTPYLYLVDRNVHCAACTKHGVWKCGACQKVSYCSASCQDISWPKHKANCKK